MMNSTDVEAGNGTAEFDSFYFYEAEQITVLWILFVAIVSGNCAVLYKVLNKKARNRRMNYFIRHLAIADLLVGLISVLTDIIWRVTISWNFGNIGCKVIRYIQVVITYGSTYILVSLSIDRCDAVRYPMQFTSSWRKARFLVWSAWIVSLLLSLPIVFLYKEEVIQEHVQCWIAFSEQWQWRLYMTLVAISLFVIPVIIMSHCYLVIILIIRSRSVMLLSNGDQRKMDDFPKGIIPKAKIKTIKVSLIIVTGEYQPFKNILTKVLMIIVAVFIICWCPYIVFDLLQVYGFIPSSQTNIAIATFIQSLAPLNSAANPLIYFVFSRHFRHFLRNTWIFRWFGCKYKQEQGNACNQSQSEILTNSKLNKVEF